MDDRLCFRAIVDCLMECGLAGGPLSFFDRPALPINMDQIFRGKKAQGGVLTGNKKALLSHTAAYISSPTAD